MIPYKEYLIEYFKGDPIVNPRMDNGKDPNRVLSRVHQNTHPKEYKHKDNIVSKIVNGKLKAIRLTGAALSNILNKYGVDFEPGTVKVLGNSKVEVTMIEDNTGRFGILKKRI